MISLDFELHWGLRLDAPLPVDRAASLFGAREAIPRMLELFQDWEIAATWAIVGFLFAATRRELEMVSPPLKPRYEDPALSPYSEQIGENEAEDPLHYAASLVERIRRTRRQEIATHTFSHFYCGESGQDGAAFRADLLAAREIAALRGIKLHSIVFPRNQHNPAYDDVLLEVGITCYRGNPSSYAWTFDDTAGSRSWKKRAIRLLDAYVPTTGPATKKWRDVLQPNGLANVSASYPLRPFAPGMKLLEPARLRRIKESLRHAAEAGEIFHLWWHPHNFGNRTRENLHFLTNVLDEADRLRRTHGLLSLTMAQAGEMAREVI